MYRVDASSPRAAVADASDASGDRGRRVVCAASPRSSAQAGDLLLREPPFAAVLDPSRWATHCRACFRSAEDAAATLSRCGRCRVAYYCSRACQQRDWKPDHVAECSTLAQLTALKLRSDQLSDILLLGRVVRRVTAAKSNPEDALSATVSPLRLAWHEADCTQETELLAVLAQKLGLVRGEATATSLQHLQRLLSRFRNNNFSICDARLVPVGAGCFPLAAMVNHSCEPNAAITFEASTHTVAFRALRSIASGEEITHAYEDMALPRTERQERLRRRYHFTCACVRCASVMSDPASRDRFLDADVDGVESAQWPQARRHQVDETTTMVAAAANATSRAEAITALTQALVVQDTVLHPDNIQRLATLSQLFTLQVQERSSLSDAVVTGEQILRVYKRVYSAHHAMVGLHLFTLGDLCAAEGSRDKAREYFTAAHETLRVTHGVDHTFVGMAQQRLAELQSAVTQP